MTTGLVILIFLLDAIIPALPQSDAAPEPLIYFAWLGGILAAVMLLLTITRKKLEKTGRYRNIAASDKLLSFGRAAVVSIHAYALIELGWSVTASKLTHNLPVLREFITALPPLLGFVALYWAYAPIQRRLREALLWRHLHQGRPILADQSRLQIVWEHIRHSILLGLIPILLLAAWRHAGEFTLIPIVPHSTGWLEWVLTAWQVLGVFVVLAFSPWLLRFVWDTVPLEGGQLRTSVENVFARNHVSAREVLVWQTSSGILNGALMGIIPHARYVLFTDALLQLLPLRQVEAVAAHEAGHGRLRHLSWLLGATIVSSIVGAMAFAFTVGLLQPQGSWYLEAIGVFTSAGSGLIVLGYISRRFELQADAFAVKDLSRYPTIDPNTVEGAEILPQSSDTVTHESAGAMIDALENVSQLNGIPPERFTWRHGTIRKRQAHLAGIVGVSLDKLPIDRIVRRLKIATLLAAGAVIILGIGAVLFAPADDTLAHDVEFPRTATDR